MVGDAACWAHLVCPACGSAPEGDCLRPLLVLVGLMGVGKTTVGRCVADRLEWEFVDNDELFERRTGTTAAGYAAEHGEQAMHDVEWSLLAEVLDRSEPTVLAAPGSVVDAPELDVREAFVVWLRADPREVGARIGGGDHRPLLGEDPGGVLTEQHQRRAPQYEELADVTLEVTGRTPAEVADRVTAAWCDHACRP